MAKFNEILVGRYNRFLQKLLSMKGGPPASQLSTEISVNIGLFHGVENRYLEGWLRFGLNSSVTGGAAQFAAIRWRNPANSNIVAVFEKLSIQGGAADTPRLQYRSTGVGLTTVNVLGNVPLDPRGQPTSSLIQSQTVNYTAAILTVMQGNLSANNQNYDFIVEENQELPLFPGDDLTLFSTTAATTLFASALWRERFLEDSERT